MGQKFNYISIETIFAKFSRDLRNADLHEADLVEWTAEALEFMKIAETQQEAVYFAEVKNHRAELPLGFQSVIQIAKYNNWRGPEEDLSPQGIVDCRSTIDFNNAECLSTINDLVVTDCKGQILCGEDNVAYYRPYFDLQWEYGGWSQSRYYHENYTPVKLSNEAFFNSVVCKETDEKMAKIYATSKDEYTLAGGFPTMELRFSFKEGFIAMAYLKSPIDPQTGYPVIPDDISLITAIMYYIKWKMAERFRWDGREGFAGEAKEAEERWLKYVRQGLNKAKMPQGEDQYQNLLDQSFYLLPRQKRQNGFFGSGRNTNSRRY